MSAEPVQPPGPLPARPSAMGVGAGCALALALHAAVSLAIVVVQELRGGDAVVVIAFWGLIGLAQLPYLLPAVLVARRAGWRGIALGLMVAGGAGLVLTAGMAALNAAPAAMERLTGDTPKNQRHSASEATVVSVSPGTLTVRFTTGETMVLACDAGTEFAYLGPGWKMQSEPASLAVLRPGRRVGVDWVLRKHLPHAVSVTIWVERPR